MATYYVDPVNGHDTNYDGNQAAVGAGRNGPFKTIGKLIAASGAMASGDTAYLAPGIYRETVSCGITSPTGETKIVGDPLNTKGFNATQGPVIWTCLTTDDVSAAAAAHTLNTNSRDFLTFENMQIEGGYYSSSYYPVIAGTGSTNIVLRRCAIINPIDLGVYLSIAAGVTAGHIIDSCIIASSLNGCVYLGISKHSAEYDAGFMVKNCVLLSCGGAGVIITSSGSNTNFGAGNANQTTGMQNCLVIGAYGINVGSGYNAALTNAFACKNNVFFGRYGVYCTNDTNPDIVTEDYNILLNAAPRTGITTAQPNGANDFATSTTTGRGVRFEMGQSALWGFHVRQFGSPLRSCRGVGFGNDSTPTALTTDILNRIRPSGGGASAASVLLSAGPYELHDYGTKDTATKDAGDASLKMVGPGDHEFKIAVDAAQTTIHIRCMYDGSNGGNTYGGTNYPQAILVDSEAFANITGNTETKTATTDANGQWQDLEFTTFTPSRKGVIRLRLVNRGSGADDICWFDTVEIA